MDQASGDRLQKVTGLSRGRAQHFPTGVGKMDRKMRAIRVIASMALVVAVLFAWNVPPAHTQAANPVKVAGLKMALRGLLVDHIFWMRSIVISTRLGESAEARASDANGVENANAIGRSIAPIYGQAAGEKFATLFVGHYSAVKAYMDAAFANNFRGNEALKKGAQDKLAKNAAEIAAFLSSANPNLPKDTVYGLFVTHAGQHMAAIEATAKKDWASEAKLWDPMVMHVNTMADALADAIAKQLPDKFE